MDPETGGNNRSNPDDGSPQPTTSSSQASHGQDPALRQFGGPSPQPTLIHPPLLTRLVWVLGFTLFLNLIMVQLIFWIVLMFFGAWQELDGRREYPGKDIATVGYNVSLAFTIYGYFMCCCIMSEIVLLSSIRNLKIIQIPVCVLITWSIFYTIYMVLWFVEFVLIYMLVVEVDKLIPPEHRDSPIALPTTTPATTNNYRSSMDSSRSESSHYNPFRNGAIAAAVVGSLFWVFRIYLQYLGVKFFKRLKEASLLAENPLGTAPQQIISQYPVGNDGGAGSPYYNYSNAYPPIQPQHY